MNRKHRRHNGYKYTLWQKLRELSVTDYEIALKWFPEMLGISPDTFRHWIYIQKGSTWEIPAAALIRMALFFDCTPTEMLTEPTTRDEVVQSWETYKQNLVAFLTAETLTVTTDL